MNEGLITIIGGLITAALTGLLATPFLTRRQIRKASEASTLEQTDKITRDRVKWLTEQFEDLQIEHQEIRTELHAERAMRRVTLHYLQELYTWATDSETASTQPLPAPPAEIADKLEG